MACPYFMPIEKLGGGSWLHEHRLPLGAGWTGQCGAPGHEGDTPSQEQLQDFCNLGYADHCGRLPRERAWDSVRFGARSISVAGGANTGAKSGANTGAKNIQVRYICERGHLPVEHGWLEFDPGGATWIKRHDNRYVQRLAECFVEAYVARREKAIVDSRPAVGT